MSPASRILIACVGNVLRGDDGFGPAVAERMGEAPAGAELLETGIGGIALLQELLVGCDGLIVVDAVERGERPGTVFVMRPSVEEYDGIPDMHLATPERVLALARGMGALPERVLLVGCQPADAHSVGMKLSPAVTAAVETAVRTVREIVDDWRADARAHG